MKVEKNHSSTDNYKFLTTAPVHRVIITMAVPTTISMLIASLYNIADTFFVGQIDTQSTAAVGIVFSVMFFIQAFAFFFGNGSGNYISRELGARNRRNAKKMASTGFFASVIFGILLCVAGECMLSPLSVWLGSTPTILPYTERYMGITLLSAPMMMGSICLNNQLRFQGNAKYGMIGISAGCIINVMLDPVFIFLFHMGVAGAAVATVIGQTCSLVILLWMTRHTDSLPIKWHDVRWSNNNGNGNGDDNVNRNRNGIMAFFCELTAGGSPSLMRQGLGCIAVTLLNVTAARYGDATVAAMSIVGRIGMLVMAAVIGLGHGFQPLCGYCYGARLYDRLKDGFWFCVRVGTIFLCVMALIGWLYTNEVVAVFRDDPDVTAIGVVALRCQLLTFPLNALMIYSNMMLQTIRMPLQANLLASARHGLFFIPLIIILPYYLGLFGVEVCQAVSDALSFLLTIPILWQTMKKLRNGNINRS